ncbi:TPA: hypothetical protein DDW69_03885 [candidate division CPR2 bacterium]|uniref:Uncharacterized protein n=1 Tax=candidate division CPR2 bacterium GW2011_GWC1_41_48 TaxID=1618344 RepID=A0A0G0W7I2_UNCC2|nr:MAG: hypothetical protein UT47_C0003G0035 [candidate division CPR2 bacterium GW2011_GWC2_39_35]KKR28609.1 MAG: hypothetical protein UT60_C0016G0009 [candidate division CPR2 bacterium GW2011_GWD2_39_7]KKS08974.1 MAG: hypothetical protein UU65_C0003G0029 [candidate division CPR2 bacterium GW2011_GWC1_41_48]OGB72923.1 MAG: hypothetical protein A2Y26_00045 [candidate division CPR2 bacterium GWD2_39_7]HBG81950.1 hypothetical protein [candidate division CPR2 bacterium]
MKILTYVFLSLVGLLYFLFYVDPWKAGFMQIVLFFGLIFMSGFSIGSFAAFQIRKSLTFIEMPKASIREGIFIGIVVTSLAILKSQNLLWFWDGFFLITAFILIEIFLLSKKGRLV